MPFARVGGQAARNGNAPVRIGNLPTGKEPGGIPRDRIVNVDELAMFINDNMMAISRYREHLIRRWDAALAILDGFHYFRFDSTGRRIDIPKDTLREVRAFIPLLYEYARNELGRLLGARVETRALPRGDQHHVAERAKLIITDTERQCMFARTYRRFLNHLIYFGFAGLFPDIDPFTKKVRVESVPGYELFPIPIHAQSDDDLDGIGRIKFLSRAWIERYAPQATDKVRWANISSTSGTSRLSHRYGGAAIQGAFGVFFWIKPNPDFPNGVRGLIIEGQPYGIDDRPEYSFPHPQTGQIIGPMNGGEFEWPIKIARYVEHPTRWEGISFAEHFISLNREANRQMSNLVEAAEYQKHMGWIFVDRKLGMKTDDFRNRRGGVVPVDTTHVNNQASRHPPIFQVQPPRMSPDVGGVFNLVSGIADRTASRPPVTRGEAPGRVDAGPGITGLLQAAMQPLESTMADIADCLAETKGRILDLQRLVWPVDGRTVAIPGDDELTQKMHILARQVPDRTKVEIEVGPLTPMGRMSWFEQLIWMRTQNPPAIDQGDFYRALSGIGMQIPGIRVYDEMDRLARYKAQVLYNDGQTPGQWDGTNDRSMNQMVVVNRLRDYMNRVEFWQTASDAVKRAFTQHLDQHMFWLNGQHMQTSAVDSETQEAEARRLDNSIDLTELTNDDISMSYQPMTD